MVQKIVICCSLFSMSTLWPSGDFSTRWQSYNFRSITEILGYDPHISFTGVSQNVIEQQHPITVYAHAWGDSQESIQVFKRNSLLLPGTIIGFNFKDANRGGSLPPFKYSSFAQGDDIAILLMVLKMLVELDIKAINLFGHSRGGGAILTTIARLYQYDYYEVFFKKLKMSKALAQRILDAITKGCIVLNCPLVDTPQLIKEKLNWAPLPLGAISEFVSRAILPFFIRYRAYEDTPIQAALVLKKNKFNVPLFIHFEKDDVIVGTKNDVKLYEYLNGEKTYMTIGNEGSHMHMGKQLGIELQAFYKKYNAPYYNDPQILAISEALLRTAQPSLDTIKSLAEDLYLFHRSDVVSYVPASLYPWTTKLKNYDMTNINKNIGYDPQIRIYQADILTIDPKANESTTVYVHGLGENAQTVIPFLKINSYLLPGTVVGFDFPDVIPGTFSSQFKKLNLAQGGDISVLVSVLKMLDESDIKIIHLFGTSRGGGTIINTLGRLCQYDKNKNFFEKLEITSEQAARIMQKIKAGTIVLNVPLVDSHAVARYWFKFLGPIIMQKIIPRITAHSPHGDQPIDAIECLQEQQFKILVHFEHKDERVGNARDAEFYKKIYGPNTYLVLADDGGHLHSGLTLEKAVQAFRKRYAGPYYNLPTLIADGEGVLKKAQPASNAIEQYVKDAYIGFEHERKRKGRGSWFGW